MTAESIQLQPATEFPFQTLVEYLNRAFEEYLVPAHFTQPLLGYFIRVDSVDLNNSRVVSFEGEPAGIALLNARGWSSRLGAFGIFKEWRGKGIGSTFTTLLIEEARKRNDRSLVLEVICENHAALKMYQKAGFEITRKLIGFEGKNLAGEACSEVQECDPRLASQDLLLLQPNLPWQVSGESLLPSSSNMRAFRLGDSRLLFHVLGNTTAQIRGLSLANSPEGRRLLRHVLTLHPDLTWRLSPAFPEDLVLPLLPTLGFTILSLSQYEMRIEFER